MTQKTIPFIIGVLAIGVMVMASLAYVLSMPRPLSSHQKVMDETKVRAQISAELTVTLDEICIDTSPRTVNALDVTDMAKRALWIHQEVPFSAWSLEYDGHPLAYIQIWGPYKGWFYVQFSKASMTTIDVEVMGETASFPALITDPPQNGLWWAWVPVA